MKVFCMSTHFSYDVQFPAHSELPPAERDEILASLSPSLQGLLSINDPDASVTDSESHKGEGHRIVELTTTLDDEQVGSAMKAFSKQYGLAVNALE